MKELKKNWFSLFLGIIVLLSIFFRFANYQFRWGLAYDQAYGAIVGQYALKEGKIPLLGPFSSAGPFQTGGEWYWFIMLGSIFNLGNPVSPWIFLSITSVLFVIIMALVSKELVDKKFAVIVAAMSAVSTSQIAQSFSLTNQSIIGIFSALAIWSSIKYLKTKEKKYIFLLGFFVSFAASIHLQGAALIFLILATLVFGGNLTPYSVLALILGLLIPAIPIIIFDLDNNFVNTRNILQYFLHDQYKISLDVLGRRWITYLDNFWPKSLVHIIGGNVIIGWLGILSAIFSFIFIVKKKLTKEWLVILSSSMAMLIYLRYLRTPLFDSYLIFLHPFIFLLLGFSIYSILKINKLIGFAILFLILFGSIQKDLVELTPKNDPSQDMNLRISSLKEKFPNSKFSIYSYKYNWAGENLALVLFLYSNNLIDKNGKNVGVVIASKSGEFNAPIIYGKTLGYQILDLQGSSSAQLKKSEWGRVNPEDIYNATEEWHKKNR